VSWLESAGARVVPLIYHEDWNVTMEKIDNLNGILYCGGSAVGNNYINWGKQIFDRIREINDNGTHYPIWGTCLGFEDLA
jgi:gamma-glutamyl hydrolase